MAFVVVFGLAGGFWSALAPLVLAESHLDSPSSLLGVVDTAPAIGGAIGPLLAGALLLVTPLSMTAVVLGIALLCAYGLLRPLAATCEVEP